MQDEENIKKNNENVTKKKNTQSSVCCNRYPYCFFFPLFL